MAHSAPKKSFLAKNKVEQPLLLFVRLTEKFEYMKQLAFLFCLAASVTYAQTNDGIFHLNKEFKINPDGTIRMNASDAKVTITGSSRTTAHVVVDRVVTTKGISFGHEEFAMDITENDGDLQIRERSNSVSVGIIGYHYEKYTIQIEAPEGTSLIIRGDDGDYRIGNIDGSISLNLDDADVELSGCSGSNFEFRLDDGDIVMDEGKGKLRIDADDADIRISNGKFTQIEADMDDGDLLIDTSLAENGDYRIYAQDGLVALTVLQGGGSIHVRHDDGRVTADSGFSTVESSEDRTNLKLGSGTARVDIRADDARVKLTSR